MGQGSAALGAEIVRLCVWLAGLVAVFVPLERSLAVHPHRVFRAGFWTDLGYYFLNSLLPAALLGPPVAVLAWGVHRVMPAGFLAAAAAMPLPARVLAGLVAGEFGYYWGHRWCHEVPLLWRFHAIHHSAEAMDFLVHTRAHPFDMAFGRFCGLVPLYVLGLAGPVGAAGSVVPALVFAAGTAWGFFIHSNVRWRFGPLEWVVSTPAFHHWHHTRSGPIDRNYASTLPWLDGLFGSLHLPPEWPEDYGIKGEMPPALVDQLIYPLVPPPAPRAQAPAAAGEAEGSAATAGPVASG